MNSLFSLKNKVAIVTGAGRGIGKALALGLAQAGADVVVAARTVADIEGTAAQIRALGKRSIPVPTDVLVSEHVDIMVRRTLEEFNRVDILVNNMGTFQKRLPTSKLREDVWDRFTQENLRPFFLCSKAVLEAMTEQGKGSIINISSLAGLRPCPGQLAYSAAKAGVINLTQGLAVEWAPYHVRVNCIAPGWMVAAYSENQFFQEIANRVPLKRAGRGEDVVGTAIYLASDASDYVTGVTIPVDGGLSSLQLSFLTRDLI